MEVYGLFGLPLLATVVGVFTMADLAFPGNEIYHCNPRDELLPELFSIRAQWRSPGGAAPEQGRGTAVVTPPWGLSRRTRPLCQQLWVLPLAVANTRLLPMTPAERTNVPARCREVPFCPLQSMADIHAREG